MNPKTLYVGWLDAAKTRAWYPVGHLDADIQNRRYRFRYTEGALRAQKEVQFRPTLEFPDLYGDYRSPRLFAMFRNRIMSPKRPDYSRVVRYLGLTQEANPIEFLAANGGYRNTDSFEVFPRIETDATRSFSFRFCLWGKERPTAAAMRRADRLEPGEDLYVTPELTTPLSRAVVLIRTAEDHVIGHAPQCLVHGLSRPDYPDYSAQVVRINPRATTGLRILLEVRGQVKESAPMSGKDFVPLA